MSSNTRSPSQTQILILGAGAIGAFYASRLALAPNVQVSCICRSNYSAVSTSGFQISSPRYGDYTFHPAHTFPSPSSAIKRSKEKGIEWDFILVSTKALPDISDESSILQGLVTQNTSIVLIQNGIGVEEPYQVRFPYTLILSGVTITSATQIRPGVVKHNRWTRVSFGPYLPSPSMPLEETITRAEEMNGFFVDLLRKGGVKDAKEHTHQKLQMVRWHKLAINAAMNPSSVLSSCTPNSDMASDPLLSSHLKAVMEEILTLGCEVLSISEFPENEGFASPEKILESTRRNDSGSRPSMAVDWLEGRNMEIEVLLGNAVRIARERGKRLERCEVMYALICMLQRNREREKGGQRSKI